MSLPTVTVIGAGIAGLTAAYRLKQKGFSVKVLEAKPAVGGRMTQRMEHGMSYNSGARLCYSFYTEVNKLINELGLQNSLVKHGNMDITCLTASGQ
ncbi:MAG: oxygen-dependent protoporphyrinogen oxidase, partial [Gammaproteobacteria bacterium]